MNDRYTDFATVPLPIDPQWIENARRGSGDGGEGR